jgi:hypothetical protein
MRRGAILPRVSRCIAAAMNAGAPTRGLEGDIDLGSIGLRTSKALEGRRAEALLALHHVIHRGQAEYLESLYQQYQRHPRLLEAQWVAFEV